MTAPEGSRVVDVAASDLMTVPEAARHIGIHADTLYRLCRNGQFPPAVAIGRSWRISVPRLRRYLHDEER